MNKHDKPLALPIKDIITESERVKTFVFDYDFPGEPGQFVMCWVPGFDEKPFGIIKKDGAGFMISVAKVGKTTEAMHLMDVGDMLGFRGPFGSSFLLPESGKKIALIAGGYGMAPLSYLAQEARKKGIETHLFIGARNKNELLFKPWMEAIGVIVHTSTDDGSAGYKGFNTDLFKTYVSADCCHSEFSSESQNKILKQVQDDGASAKSSSPQAGQDDNGMDATHFDKVYTVGPEIMELKIAQICWEKNIPFEVSLERFMKCGIGICGQCCVDPVGWRMCVEGPVIDGEKLKKIEEFGKYHRTASGKVEKYPWVKIGV